MAETAQQLAPFMLAQFAAESYIDGVVRGPPQQRTTAKGVWSCNPAFLMFKALSGGERSWLDRKVDAL